MMLICLDLEYVEKRMINIPQSKEKEEIKDNKLLVFFIKK